MKKKILVIEDDKTFCKTIVNLLQQEGYDVESAGNSEQALKVAENGTFDLIISDVRLPGKIDGIEVVRRIKTSEQGIKTVVIIMTGYTDEDAPKRAGAIGINEYILKPFSLDAFLVSIREHLGISLIG